MPIKLLKQVLIWDSQLFRVCLVDYSQRFIAFEMKMGFNILRNKKLKG